MKSNLLQARGLACGLAIILVLIGFGTRSNAGYQAGVKLAAAEKRASVAIQRATIPGATEKPVVLALAEPVTPLPSPKPPALGERPRAAAPAWPTPARFFTINQVLAERKQVASRLRSVQLAAADPTGTASDVPATTLPPVRSDEPFGLFMFRAPEGMLSIKWRKVKAAIRAEAHVLARCRAEPEHCSPAVARFISIVKDAAARQGRAKLELVNRRINAAIRYMADTAQWGALDLWSAPLDSHNKGSFNTGFGDCEDYAIAKYVALRDAGVADEDLHLLLVRDNTVHTAHAVLAAHQDGRWLILDNRWARLLVDIELKQFVPLFALNEHGVKLFAAPYAANQAARL